MRYRPLILCIAFLISVVVLAGVVVYVEWLTKLHVSAPPVEPVETGPDLHVTEGQTVRVAGTDLTIAVKESRWCLNIIMRFLDCPRCFTTCPVQIELEVTKRTTVTLLPPNLKANVFDYTITATGVGAKEVSLHIEPVSQRYLIH
jgi:hypothetical protein